MEKMDDLIQEISAASRGQFSGVDEINTGLGQVNQVIQQSSSISEQTASSAQELQFYARTLQKLTSGFTMHPAGNLSMVIEG